MVTELAGDLKRDSIVDEDLVEEIERDGVGYLLVEASNNLVLAIEWLS